MKKVIPFLASALAFLPQSVISQDAVLVDTGEAYGHGPYYGVEYYNNASYVNDGSDQIKVFDVSDASDITLSGEVEVGCTVGDLDLDGSILVAKCPFEIHFYDLTDSLDPELVGSYDSTGYAVNSVELSGDRLYIGGGNSDIAVFDASDLSNIQEINTQTFGSISTGELKQSGNFVYTISNFTTVKIFDISNEENITETTEIFTDSTLFRDVLIIDNTLYIAATDGLRVYDVTNMAGPSHVKTINSGSIFNTIDQLSALHVVGDTLYTGKNNAWVFEFDITTAQDPIFLDQFRYSTGTTNQITDDGTNIYIAYGIDGLASGRISPSNKLGHYLTSILPYDISMDNGRTLVSDETGLFHIIDISTEDTFSPQSRLPYTSYTFSGEIKGNIAWLGAHTDLETRDLSTLAPPTLVDIQTVDSLELVTYVREINGNLYVGTDSGRVALYDVSSDTPSLISSVTFPVDAENHIKQFISDIVVHGDYVIVSSLNAEFLVADFTDPLNPFVVDVPKLSEATDANLFISGNQLLSASSWGVFLVDISDIENPVYGASLSLGSVTAATRLDEETVLLSSTNGLLTVNIADPANITIVSKIENAPEFSNLATDGNYVVGSVRSKSELKLYKFNKIPTTSDYQFSTDEDNAVVEYVEATDPEGDDITFSIAGEPANGVVDITAEGQFTYAPDPDYNGQDTFTFKAEDSFGASSEGTVSITVNPVNDAPNAANVSLTTTVDSSVSGSFNASDVDGDELTYEHTNPSNGSLTVSGSSFTYTPATDFSGQDSFQYTVTDSGGDSVTATVTITVNKPASSGGGGGSGDLWLLALLLLGVAFRRQFR